MEFRVERGRRDHGDLGERPDQFARRGGALELLHHQLFRGRQRLGAAEPDLHGPVVLLLETPSGSEEIARLARKW